MNHLSKNFATLSTLALAIALAIALLLPLPATANPPLPNGSTAPNWTLTDENGVTHTLYDYLDQGYTVYVEFFATWCGICWNYKQANHLKNLYEQYGPNGTDQVRVFLIEGDVSTSQASLYGGAGSVGNWVAGTPYPVIHAPSGAVPSAYIVNSYPTQYAICPDRKAYNIGTAPLATLVNWIGSCNLDATANVTDAFCAGQASGSIDLTPSGGFGAITYNWSNGPNTQDINNLLAGNYSCTLTDGFNRSISRGPFAVDAPQAIVASGQATQPSCQGNDGALAVSAVGGTPPYTYDAGTGSTSNPIISGLSAGLYQVSVTDVNGCEKVIDVEVPQETPPVANSGPDLVITCDEVSVQLDADGSSSGPNIVLVWTTPDGLILNPGSLTPSAGAPGTYILSIVDTNTGCVSSDTTLVTADQDVPQIDILPFEPLNCENTQITITALDLGPCFSYTWTTVDGNIILIDENEIVIADPGTYHLLVTNTCTGCTATSATVVYSAADFQAEPLPETDVLCAGDSTGSAEILTSGGTEPYAYQWSSGQTETLAQNLPAGSYSVTATDSGGCEEILEFEIQEPEAINIIIGEITPASGPNAQDGGFSALIEGGVAPYTATVYFNGVLLNLPDWNALFPGEYQVQLIDANGCEYWSELFTVPFNSATTNEDPTTGFRLWPNPAADFVFLEWDQPLTEDGLLRLYNSIGQECLLQAVVKGSSGDCLDISSQPAGIYLLVFETKGRRNLLGKVISD
ncbi:MAG: T9SS type A sorting domain-containing protein [Saprospirales bacterium]|nr:T9SS type A sorting domain-containing protein [Saprospirales bacterium]